MNYPYKNIRLFTVVALLLSLCVFSSCDTDDDDVLLGEWQKSTDFAGVARSSAVSFVIDGKAYVGTGYDGSTRLNDFWVFDPATESWTRKADLPGPARSGAVAFAANGKGYIGTGYDGTSYLKDFYEYDPATDAWTQIADFPASARYGAIAMSLANKGYVGAGYDGTYLNDFWQYDPATNAWAAQAGLNGARRLNGFAFTVNGKGYVGGGQNNNVYQVDFIEFDPATGQWSKKKNLDRTERPDETFPLTRTYGTTFTINNHAYLVNGYLVDSKQGPRPVNDVWKYDPLSDTWTELGAFKGGSRVGTVGFGIGEFGYVGLGNAGSLRYTDFWKLDPRIANED